MALECACDVCSFNRASANEGENVEDGVFSLVSDLERMSIELDGLKRQLATAMDQLSHMNICPNCKGQGRASKRPLIGNLTCSNCKGTGRIK